MLGNFTSVRTRRLFVQKLLQGTRPLPRRPFDHKTKFTRTAGNMHSSGLELFSNPGDDFIKETFDVSGFPDTKIERNETRTVTKCTFPNRSFSEWTEILGEPLNTVFSAMSNNLLTLVSNNIPLFHPGFVKAAHMRMSDEYLSLARKGRASEMTSQVSVQSTVFYVAEKAYIWGSDISVDDLPSFYHRNLVIGIDILTRKPGRLDDNWRRNALEHIRASNKENVSQMKIPDFHKETYKLVNDFTVEIKEGHTDFNKHTNYKIYIFGAFVCLRKAMEEQLIPGLCNVEFRDVTARDIFTVFLKECLLGDVVQFVLYEMKPMLFYAECLRGDTVLARVKFELAKIIDDTQAKL